MNKYSDISNRYYLKHSPFHSQSPKFLKSFRNDDIFIFNSYSESPDISYNESGRTNLNQSPRISHMVSEKNLELSEFPLDPKESYPQFLTLPKISVSSPRSDFSSLLRKLDKVTSPKPKFLHTILREDSSSKITQPTDEFCYFKANCKGKKCPLQVKIKIYEGQLITYMSFTEVQPGPAVHDRVYHFTHFEVSDNNYSFKNENVFFGVKSFSDCVYKIEINYGKEKSMVQLKLLRKLSMKQEKYLEVEEEIEEVHAKSTKNFIKGNIAMVLQSTDRTHIAERVKEWERKKNMALVRKKELIKGKKQKTIEYLNRRQRYLEEQEALQKQIEKEQAIRKVKKALVGVSFLLKFTTNIREIIAGKREKIFLGLRKSLQATRIQKAYKNSIKFPDGMAVIALAQKLIKFYQQAAGPVLRRSSNKKIVLSISSSAHTNSISHQIRGLRIKVLFIQRQLKVYRAKKVRRMKILINQWTACIEKALFSKKNTKVRRKESNKYITIPYTRRNAILNDYYLEKWKQFRENMRNFLKSVKNFKLVRSFTNKAIEAPEFIFVPADGEMENLIRIGLINKAKQ